MRRCYLANVSFVDHQVGLIVQALKDAGIYENTAIIFISDHGDYLGNRGAPDSRSPYEWHNPDTGETGKAVNLTSIRCPLEAVERLQREEPVTRSAKLRHPKRRLHSSV